MTPATIENRATELRLGAKARRVFSAKEWNDALRAALDAALAAGDLDLAAELLTLLRARGAHLRRVG